MQPSSGSTLSLWAATTEGDGRFLRLESDQSADVCVIGAGMAGLSVAYYLAKAGKSVVVLDDGPVAGGESIRTTAHLSNAIDDRFYELEKVHGIDKSKLAAWSHSEAIDRIELIAREEGIDCDFVRLSGYLFPAEGEDPGNIEKEFEATHRVGLTQVTKVDRAPIDAFNTGPALLFPDQGQFHAGKYFLGLARAASRLRARIFTGCHVVSFHGGRNAHVMTQDGITVHAQAVVVCTNSPVNDRVTIHTKQMPYRTYVIAARVPAGSITPALYWDDGDPYHYVRLQRAEEENADFDYLIVGGEDHKTGQAFDFDDRFARLEKWAHQRWPRIIEVTYRWSGQVMETDDYLGFIGRNPNDADNVYIATGDSGMGMTHGMIAGILISDLILDRWNPWVELYDPARVKLMAAAEWAKQNINTFAQYREYVTGGDVSSVDEIKPGQGAVVRHGALKVACYRDDSGRLHEHSAVCPHLGGIVHWNSLEKSWDCPAHGSRFDVNGCVLNGPANAGLAGIKEEQKKAA
jgi:glycine/D-amino acid oxidase-like deaminating enzyme/nitrite reductase/ring-hydroxylating ferredoxin subunit